MTINIDNNIDYFIIYNGKLMPKNAILSEYMNNTNNTNNTKFQNIEIIERQRGGGFMDIITGIIKIGEVFIKIGEFIEWLALFVVWFIQFILWVFIDLLNPVTLANEFFNSLMVILIAILRLPFDLFIGLFAIVINSIGGWMQGFWGWDQSSLTKADKNSKYFSGINRKKGTKYYLTNSNTVPFSVILGTLLCPPMGVFMDMGTAGWLNIIVCCLLTLIFYLPGLFYALLIIYT